MVMDSDDCSSDKSGMLMVPILASPGALIPIPSRREFSPAKLHLIPLDFSHMIKQESLVSGLPVGDSVSTFLSWQNNLQLWTQYCSQKITTLQSKDWRLQVENKSLGGVVQLQTHFLQELKKYNDKSAQELWNKLYEVWIQHGAYCQQVAHTMDKQANALGQLHGESRMLVQAVQQLSQQQIPELVHQVDSGLQSLGQKPHECFLGFELQMKKVVSDLQEIHGVFQQVSCRFDEVNRRLGILESMATFVSVPSTQVELTDGSGLSTGYPDYVLAEARQALALVNKLNGKY